MGHFEGPTSLRLLSNYDYKKVFKARVVASVAEWVLYWKQYFQLSSLSLCLSLSQSCSIYYWRAKMAFEKIKVANPIVEMDGETFSSFAFLSSDLNLNLNLNQFLLSFWLSLMNPNTVCWYMYLCILIFSIIFWILYFDENKNSPKLVQKTKRIIS